MQLNPSTNSVAENPAYQAHNQQGSGNAHRDDYVNASLMSDFPQHFEGHGESHSWS